MPHQDQLHRYLFSHADVRGELVNISETWQAIIAGHHYPTPVRILLGEMLVATSLLTATLKFAGDITVQLQSDGPLKVAVINGNHQQQMRGIARLQGEIDENSTLQEMAGNGYLVITITPEKGERYQGVVSLEGDTLAACLEAYFRQSEQLPTRLFIRTREKDGIPGAGGILLQTMPGSEDQQQDKFSHLATLTETISTEELINLPAQDVLWRLYHQEEVTLYEPQSVSFHCSCSRERCNDVLTSLSQNDVDSILAEDGKIDMHCDYCGAHYIYNAADVDAIRRQPANNNRHLH